MAKLRYRISSLEQLIKCKSNLSDKYSIHVSTVDNMPDISGTLVQVVHEQVGVVFSMLMNAKGDRVDSSAIGNIPGGFIIQCLSIFGFCIEYRPEDKLSSAQIEYLQELLQLFMDRIRPLTVSYREDNKTKYKIVLTAYSSAILPQWSYLNYRCSLDEFSEACVSGYAIRLNDDKFDWSWLTYSANITDLINNKKGTIVS